MKKQLIKSILVVIAISLWAVQYLLAQQNTMVTAADSVVLKRYLDSVDNAPVYSRKRQRYLDSALAIKPDNASWWQQKGMPLMKQKKYEAGMDFIDSAVKYDIHQYIDYRAFMKCIFQKNYRGAIKDFETSKSVIGAGSVIDHGYDFYLGLCHLMLTHLDSAEYYLTYTTNEQRKSLGEHFVHPLDLFYLGIVFWEKEEYAKAVETLDVCLKLYPKFSDAQYYKAICLKKLHKDERALSVIKEAALNFKEGYTMNEDNLAYEIYPFQVTKQVYFDKYVEFFAIKTN